MPYCDLKEDIFSNIHVDCDVAKGFEEQAVFLLRSEVDFAKLKNFSDETLPNTYIVPANETILKEYTTTAGTETHKGAVVFQLRNAFSGTTTSLEQGDLRNTFTNNVAFNVWSSSPKASAQIDALANGTYVAILKQLYKGTEGNSGYEGGAVYRVYGVSGSGLKATAIENDPYSDSISNGWTVTLTEEGATSSMKFLQAKDAQGATSEVATEALFKTLYEED